MSDPRAQVEIGAVDRTAAAFAQIRKNVESLDAPFLRISQVLGAVTGGAVAGFAGAMIRAAEQAEQSSARMNAVLKATGNQSGFTAKQLDALAEQMARATQFDDEAFRDATAHILKFGNVAGDQLTRLLKLSADYAALNKTDVASAAETLGRALASPAQGIERLQRSIGYLSPAVKESITELESMGRTLEAQDKILQLIEERIGGTAAEMNKGLTGSIKGLTKAFQELNEVGGQKGGGVIGANLDFIAGKLRAVKVFVESEQKTIDFLRILAGGVTGGPLEALRRADVLGDRLPAVGAPDSNAAAILAGRNQARADAEAELRVMDELVRHNKWAKEQEKEAARDALREKKRLRELDAAGWIAKIEADTRAYEEELLAFEKMNDAFRASEAKKGEDFVKSQLELIDKQREEEDEAMRRAAAGVPSQTEAYIKNLKGLWGEAASRGAAFFNDLLFSGEKALETLKRHLKSFLAEIVAVFARRWILQLGATMTGSTALAAMAGEVGQGTMAGSAAGGLGGFFGGAGALLPGGTVGTAFANIASMGASTFGAGGALATTIGQIASFIPIIGSVIAIGALLHSIFGDKGENPNFRIYQGTGGAGAFGGLDFTGNYNAGDMSPLLAAIGGYDRRFTNLLGAEGSAAATARLAAYSQAGLRSDGQPAQFAFPQGDQTAAEQVAREILQSRYGILFEGLDAGIAEQIRKWSGTSTDLQQFIDQTLSIIESLAGLGVRGLDISALTAMQREGERLDATFQRVGGAWSQFTEMFTTDAERLASAQDQLTTVFAGLGVAMPASYDAWRNLVLGIDASTEAGRALINALADVPGAVQAVTAAYQSQLAAFDAFDRTRSGVSQLDTLLNQFRGGRDWASGYDNAGLLGQLRTIQRQDFLNYSLADQGLINQILALVAGGSTGSAGSGVRTWQSMLNPAASGLKALAEAADAAKKGLRGFLEGLLLDEQLSPLSPHERLGQAQELFLKQLGLAQGGDVGAFSSIGGVFQQLLDIARGIYGSNADYNAIFQSGFEALSLLSGFDVSKLFGGGSGTTATEARWEEMNLNTANLLAVQQQQAANDTAWRTEQKQGLDNLTTAVNALRTSAGRLG